MAGEKYTLQDTKTLDSTKMAIGKSDETPKKARITKACIATNDKDNQAGNYTSKKCLAKKRSANSSKTKSDQNQEEFAGRKKN